MIRLAQPTFLGVEGDLVEACLHDPPNLSMGGFTKDFEEIYADWIGVEHAVACSSGTTALQLAFHVVAEIASRGLSDYRPSVFIPDLTYIATAGAISQWRDRRAQLVAIDVNYSSWNMEPRLLEEASPGEGDIIIPVHLYGNPCEMKRILDLADKCGAYVIEDACQAQGARYYGKKVGSLGIAGVFSFFGNKILTTGEGGMITTNDTRVAERCRYLRGQAAGPNRYKHDEIGFNFRITELQSAIGVGQVMLADNHIEARDDVRRMYKERLKLADVDFQWPTPGSKTVAWLETVRLSEQYNRDHVMAEMLKAGVETRPTFVPITRQIPYAGIPRYGAHVSDSLSNSLLSLPTHASLTRADIDEVCNALLIAMGRCLV